MDEMKENDYGVIEQEYSHVDYNEDGEQNFIVEEVEEVEVKKEEPTKSKKENINRCQFTKKNGKQCRQCGKENQTGGEIVGGFCNYHRKN